MMQIIFEDGQPLGHAEALRWLANGDRDYCIQVADDHGNTLNDEPIHASDSDALAELMEAVAVADEDCRGEDETEAVNAAVAAAECDPASVLITLWMAHPAGGHYGPATIDALREMAARLTEQPTGAECDRLIEEFVRRGKAAAL